LQSGGRELESAQARDVFSEALSTSLDRLRDRGGRWESCFRISGGGAQHEPPRGVVEHDVAVEAAGGEPAPLAVERIEKHAAEAMRSSRVAGCGGGLPQPVAEPPAAPREAARFEEQSGPSEEAVELRPA